MISYTFQHLRKPLLSIKSSIEGKVLDENESQSAETLVQKRLHTEIF